MHNLNNIHTYPTPDELTLAAAQFINTLANQAVQTHGRFTIALSGGHTPERLYTLLSTPPFAHTMPWANTHIFWGDERCVPLQDKDNNAQMAFNTLLNKIDIPSANIHRIPTNLSPDDAALKYEHTIQTFFTYTPPRFDLILLGLGENGHTASLFPNTDVLQEKTRLVKEVYVAELNMYRITMTLLLINQAHNILFLAEGAGKANILHQLFTTTNQYPAQLINPIDGHLYWYLDAAAAAQIR